MRRVIVITGMQAAGKTTVGQLLARKLPPPAGASDGDVFYRMIKDGAGHVDMSPKRDPEAVRQVRLRYDAAALVAQHYASSGFNFVYTDIILGADLVRWMESIQDAERHLVVLNPAADKIAERELARGGRNSYRDWQEPGMTLVQAVVSMQEDLVDTPRRGLWIDSSHQSPEETLRAILCDDMVASLY